MSNLLKPITVLKLVFIEILAYRVHFSLQVLSGILSSLIVVFLWLAVYRSAGQGIIGGYSAAEMITYLLGGGLLNSFLLTTAENPEASQSIQDGTLSSLLLQPYNPFWIWFFRDLGRKAFLFILGLLGYLVVSFLFRDYLVLRTSGTNLSLFLFSMILAAILQFILFECLSLLSFWLENTYGVRFTMRVIMEVAGGAIIPLSFFPQTIQKIFFLLPFPYLIYLPMKIYLGKIPLDEALREMLTEGAWIAVLSFLSLALWKKGLQRYMAMGD
jgi:ABC-2 type transport system permease protein